MRYTRSELAELLGVEKRHISAWCSPSKKTIIADIADPDIIDDAIEKNKRFIKRKLTEKNLDIPVKPAVANRKTPKKAKDSNKQPTTKPSTSKPKDEYTPEVDTKHDEATDEYNRKMNAMADMDLEIKKTNLLKIQKDVELKDIEIEKKKGDFINTDAAVLLFKELSQEKDKEIISRMERLIQTICDRESISREKAIRHKSKVIDIINEINTKGRSQIEARI